MTTPDANNLSKTNKKTVHKSIVPKADADFSKVVVDVNKAWASNSWLTLQWTDQATFGKDSTEFSKVLNERNTAGGSRPQITKALAQTDDEINKSLKYIKDYLADTYSKDTAPSYYGDFGIVHVKNTYQLPSDHNNRKEALQLFIAAISKHGLDSKKYGLAYWTNLQSQFNTLLDQSIATDGDISSKASNKNALKLTLQKTLNSIVNSIKAHFPDTYKAELRAWGFQKEKY